MGRRGRRTVLQLGDSSDGFLAKYGYNRQEEEIQGDKEDSEEEVENEGARKTPPLEMMKGKENGDHIDDQVANFLAQLEHGDSSDIPERPSFNTADTEPQSRTGKNPYIEEPEPSYVSNKAKSMYKNMFVKGDVEFAGKTEYDSKITAKEPEVEWPEEPVTVWQQTLDDNTQCYYYWNTVTNEVTWDIPPDFTQYLLQMKSYEEKVAKLQKEGKVKPEKKEKEQNKQSVEGPSLPPVIQPSPSAPDRKKEVKKPDNVVKDDTVKSSDSKTSNSSSKKTLVAAAYFDSDAESSGSDSDSGDEGKKKKTEKKKDSDEDIDLDLDDIDKALEVALEKKKTKPDKEEKKESKSKTESKPSLPKKLTLIDSIKEQVQRKMEVEARRKAAIEEMMARELERRVGPPRKRSGEDETVWDSKRPKIVDYGHSRSRSPAVDSGRSDDRDSRRRYEGHRDRDSDRHSHKEKKKKKDKDRDRDEHRHKDEKRRDSNEKHDHKDRKKDKKKDKDEKRRDKDYKKDKEEKKEKDEKKDKERDKEKEKDKDKKKDRHEENKTEEKAKEIVPSVEREEILKTVDEKTEHKPVEEKIDKPVIPEEKIVVKQEKEEKEEKALDMDIDAELENIVTGKVKPDVDLANKKMQASELADLALSKLEFLEVTKKGLSKLQILLVELETRHQDWQAGGLNTEFYLVKLEEANWQLEQYEKSAAPPGWSCHWDRSYRRYFYMNKRTKQTQWDYPDDDDDEEEEEPSRDSSPDQEQAPIKQEPVQDKSMETEAVTSTTPEQEETTATNEDVSSTQVSKEDLKPTQHADGWPDYEAVTNYISGTEYSGVIRGEPPPPGTDLEFLLTAPPPPPPPEEETDKGYSYDVPGPPENQGTDDMDMDNVDSVAMEEDESTPIQSSDMTGDQYSESHTSDPSVITGAPQMFTDMSYPSYYEGEADTGGQYQDMGQYYSKSDNPNSVETSGIGDASLSQQEKRKKKKDKQSSGQLKNKGMSNLVQKWQKVKKEVEIEEQAREEKQQAIRQKLNEWKKEYS